MSLPEFAIKITVILFMGGSMQMKKISPEETGEYTNTAKWR